MGYKASKAAHRLSLKDFDGSENWVEIKEGRSSAAKERYSTAGMEISGAAADLSVFYIRNIDTAARRNILFQQSILAWSLKADDDDPKPMPCTAAEYDQLDDALGDWLEKQILDYYAARQLSEDALKNSPESSTELSAVVASP